MHATPRLALAVAVLALATITGCNSVANMAERTALAEAGLLQTKPGSDEYARYYRYFPDAQVYHNPWQDRYYWLDGTKWRSGAELPAGIDLGDTRPVNVTLYTARPYQEHKDVLAQYPPSGGTGIPAEAWATVPTSD